MREGEGCSSKGKKEGRAVKYNIRLVAEGRVVLIFPGKSGVGVAYVNCVLGRKGD